MARKTSPKTALDHLFSASQNPIYVLDDAGTIVYCNPALAQWAGLASEELIGHRVEYHSEHPTDATPGAAAGLCPPPPVFGGVAVSAHVSCLTRDGRLVFRLGHFEPLLDAPSGTDGPSTRVAAIGVIATLGIDNVSPEVVTAHLTPNSQPNVLHAVIRKFRLSQYERVEPAVLIGESAAMQTVRRQIDLAATSNTPVAIIGPPGSGREHLAKAIHYHPPFNDARKLIPLDGQSLGVEELRWATESLREVSHAGRPNTLLVRNVDRASLHVQRELQSFISGPHAAIQLLATTANDLRDSNLQNMEDRLDAALASTLSTLVIELPLLKHRRNDLPLIAQYIVEECNRASGNQIGGLQEGAIELLAAYEWPGGLGELREVISVAHAAAAGLEISASDLPAVVHHAAAAASLPDGSPELIDLDAFLSRVERELINRALGIAGGNKTRAAELLCLNRPRFYRRLMQLGME